MAIALVNPPLAKTPLYDWHLNHRGRMVDFAGWSMPVQYESIIAEHEAVRAAVGLFDISHMGRLTFAGPAATAFLDSLLTRRVVNMQVGQIRYSLVTNDAGGILDDVLLYRLSDESVGSEISYLLVVNASNRQKIVDWIGAHIAGHNVICSDETFATAMIAVQGPGALELVVEVLNPGLKHMRYYHGRRVGTDDELNVISRTGYTGENGFEIIVPAGGALDLWQKLLAVGQKLGVSPTGLGARDTLRLEAAMPLYGHELSEAIDPFTAGLDFAVNLEDRSFPGRDVLARIADGKIERTRVGLESSGKRVPREGCAVYPSSDSTGGSPVGNITSGTFSPTLKRPIAMGYVATELAKPGTELAVDIRGQSSPARVVPLPFYHRPKQK